MSTEFVPVAGVVLDRLKLLGIDVALLLRQAGIAASRFQGSRAKLTVHEFFAFWRALETVGGSRDIALRLGGEVQPHQWDVASLAAVHSPNLAEALAKFARYKRVVCGEQVHVDTTDHEARVRFDWPHVAQSPPTLLVEVTLASIVALANYGTGHALVPVRIELARTRGDEFMLQKAFGCPIQFDAPHDVLVLERAALACPFITSNAELVAMLLPVLESAVEEVSITRSLADDVRATLRRSMSGERPSVDKVAEAVRLSPRTLQRRLGELGTSCQSMLDDVRRDTARRLLTHTDLDACEVAFLVGFEELDSFTRAFATWEGMTPSRWRGRTDAAGGAR